MRVGSAFLLAALTISLGVRVARAQSGLPEVANTIRRGQLGARAAGKLMGITQSGEVIHGPAAQGFCDVNQAEQFLMGIGLSLRDAQMFTRGIPVGGAPAKALAGTRMTAEFDEAFHDALVENAENRLELPTQGLLRFSVWEQLVNDIHRGVVNTPMVQTRDIPHAYNPQLGASWEMPYMWVPADPGLVRTAENISDESRAFLFKEVDGVQLYRYFAHPRTIEANESQFRTAIRKNQRRLKQLGIADKVEGGGDFVYGQVGAVTSSSPRSPIVFALSPEAGPAEAFVHKVSLEAIVGGLRRVNKAEKLYRSGAINDVFRRIPDDVKEELGMAYFPETAQLRGPEGLAAFGNIHREIPPELANGQTLAIGGFALASQRLVGTPPLIVEILNRWGETPEQLIGEKIFRPIVKQWAYLVVKESIIGEPHQQNVALMLTRNMRPNGFTYQRDLDSYHTDILNRALSGRSVEGYLDYGYPFLTFNHVNPNEAVNYVDPAYHEHLRNDWADIFEVALQPHAERLGLDASFFENHELRQIMDRMLIQELHDLMGTQVVFGAAAPFFTTHHAEIAKMFPRAQWSEEGIPDLSTAQVTKLMETYPLDDIFGNIAENYTQAPFRMAPMMADYRVALAEDRHPIPAPREELKAEYVRLTDNYRANHKPTRRNSGEAVRPPQNARYELYRGAIVAFKPDGDFFGMVLMEPEGATADFYATAKHPREAPGDAAADLWKRIRRYERETGAY